MNMARFFRNYLRKDTFLSLLLVVALFPTLGATDKNVRQSIVPTPLLPERVIDFLINEVSGEIQLNNEQLLAAFERNRKEEEYRTQYYESKIIFEKLKEYGIEACGIEEVPIVLIADKTWDAESAELWMVEPEKKKLICLEDVPSCLCQHSRTADVTADLIYVGPGDKDVYYEGKDVKGKLVLATARPFEAHNLAVRKYGAKGLVVYNSPNSDFDQDQVGWDTISRDFRSDDNQALAFGFQISRRMGEDLRKMLEEDQKVILQAKCRTAYYPARNELVWALIPGKDKPEEELIFTAHLFEGIAKQGANDNISGSVSILETARVITTLIKEGKIPPLKRSIRFLWVEEHVGTLGYLMKYPEVQKKCFANINEDMVGESLLRNFACFHMHATPYSLPSYLNDVVANFIEYVGETNRDNIVHRPVKFIKPILSPTGTKDPFFYEIEKYYGASDHDIFLDGGISIPAVGLNVWPDMWYHSNLDRPDKSDSTQFKRVSVIDTAAAIFLATASKKEAYQLLGEVLSRGSSRLGEEERRAYALLSLSAPGDLKANFKEARNIVRQAFLREEQALRSVELFAGEGDGFRAYLERICRRLNQKGELSTEALKGHYEASAAALGLKAEEPQMTAEEKRLSQLVPIRTALMKGYFNRREFARTINGMKLPSYDLRRYEDFEIRNFIDGKRNVLEIRNAVSAEFRPLPLSDVENYIRVLEAGGFITIEGRVRIPRK